MVEHSPKILASEKKATTTTTSVALAAVAERPTGPNPDRPNR